MPEAIALLERIRDATINKLGTDHPDTLATLNNLAVAYQVIGRLSEALSSFEQVRDTKLRKLGADHPETLNTLHNLAIVDESWVDRPVGSLGTANPVSG